MSETYVAFAPDDSDLMDSPPVATRTSTTPRIGDGARAVGSVKPVHGLSPVSARFWFSVFPHTAVPDVDALNAGDGLAHACFPADLRASARPQRIHWFCIDEDLVYLSFSNDWGPLNIAMFYRFCVHVHQMLIDDEMASMHLCLYTSNDAHAKANAALLCALYAMTIDHISPADAFYPYSEMELMPFRDAGYGRADYSLTMQDVLYGMRRALDNQLLDLTTFDLEAYEHYEQVQHGDWNWITPHFLAFASPKDKAYVAMLAASGNQPAAVPFTTARPTGLLASTIGYFAEKKVGLVVRLNNPLYNSKAFTAAGMEHQDLYFDDGSNPSDEIVQTFIAEADRMIHEGRALAVHCKAGLGRTGVLIGAYLIWKYQFTASEVIGYMRIMRPGCVVGPQQHYMYEQANTWMQWGIEHRLRRALEKTVPVHPKTPTVKRSQDVDETPRTLTRAKPTPCVGQPRKSPNPKRRRMGLGDSVSSEGSDGGSRVVSDELDASRVEALTDAATELRHARTDEDVLGVMTRDDVDTHGEAPEAASPARATRPLSSARPRPVASAAPAPAPAPATRPVQSTRPVPSTRPGAAPALTARPVQSTHPAPASTRPVPAPRVRRVMSPVAPPTTSAAPKPRPSPRRREGENVPPARRFVARPRP